MAAGDRFVRGMLETRIAGTPEPRGAAARTVKARANAWRPLGCAGAMTTTKMATSKMQRWNIPLSERKRKCGYFGLSAAVFLHSERNFLRSLP